LANWFTSGLSDTDITGIWSQFGFQPSVRTIVFEFEQPRSRIEWNEEREVLSQACCNGGCALKCWNFSTIHRSHASGEIVSIADPFIGHFDYNSECISVVIINVIFDAVNTNY